MPSIGSAMGRDRAAEAIQDLTDTGSAFICTGHLGIAEARGFEWELRLLAPHDDVVAAVKFISHDNGHPIAAYVTCANVAQLDRLGRSIATAVGLMRRWEALA